MEFKGMKLIDLIEGWNDEDELYLGSLSGYILVGTRSEILSRIEAKSQMLQEKFENEYMETYALIKELTNTSMERDSKETLTNYAKRLEAHCNKLTNAYQLLPGRTKRYETFIPLKDRTVRDVYKSIRDDSVKIIFTGYEIGGMLKGEINEDKSTKGDARDTLRIDF